MNRDIQHQPPDSPCSRHVDMRTACAWASEELWGITHPDFSGWNYDGEKKIPVFYLPERLDMIGQTTCAPPQPTDVLTLDMLKKAIKLLGPSKSILPEVDQCFDDFMKDLGL